MANFFRNPKYNAERILQKNLENGVLSEDDAEIIRSFISYLSVTGTQNPITLRNYVNHICALQRLSPRIGVRDLTTETIFSKTKSLHDSEYKQNTKAIILISAKHFWKYLIKKEIIKADIKEIRLIKNIKSDMETTMPNDILTVEEVQHLISAAGTARNRAIISVLYESMCRISELANLRWCDIEFDKNGAGVYVHDRKTNKIRYCRLIVSVRHLIEWRNDYGRCGAEASGENRVFITYNNQQISYITYCKIIKNISKAAGINKRIHAHLFRKSRITHMVEDNYTESVIKKMAWGNTNTSQFERYVRLSRDSIDKECMRHHPGLREVEEENNSLRCTKCVRCGAVLTPDQSYCSKCGLPTDPNNTGEDEMCIDPELITKVLQILQSQGFKKQEKL